MATGRTRWWLPAALALAPLYYALGVVLPRSRLERAPGWVSLDTYGYFYPNLLHAGASLGDGVGWVWNPFQNCGQPFMAMSVTGLYYPLHWLFYVLPREPALLASLFVHLVIGGTGVYLLLRNARISAVAAFAGALAFQVGGSSLQLGGWSPMHIAPYVWIPWALLATERLLAQPSAARTAALAAVLGVQLLPGFPQTAFFTYQLVLLRVVYALASVERPTLAGSGAVIVALVIAPLLVAFQYLPAIEVAAESARGSGLNARDLTGLELNRRAAPIPIGDPLARVALIAPILLAAAAAFRRATWRPSVFYLAVAGLYLVLRLGPGTPLFDLYVALPAGNLFGYPDRFLGLVSFALAMLAGLGVEALLRNGSRTPVVRALPVAVMPLGVLLVATATPALLSPTRWALAAAVIGVGALAVAFPVRARPLAWLLVAAIAVSSMPLAPHSLLSQKSGPLYERDPEVIAQVRNAWTPQDRVHFGGARHASKDGNFGPLAKLGSIHRLPAVFDYEPQTTRRFAEYRVFTEIDRPAQGLRDLLLSRSASGVPANANLFNLTAARHVVLPTDPPNDARRRREAKRIGWTPVYVGKSFQYFVNPHALPRARFVSVAAVIPEAQLLRRLARPYHDPSTGTLLAEAPESGFLGTRGARGSVTIRENRSRRIVLDVEADGAGFVHLADQHFPGWTAEVDGEARQILRADHVFRLVEVPEGRSTVVFEYRPWTVPVGAGVSLASAIALCAVSLGSRRRRPTQT